MLLKQWKRGCSTPFPVNFPALRTLLNAPVETPVLSGFTAVRSTAITFMDQKTMTSLSLAEIEKPIEDLRHKIEGAVKTTNEISKDLRQHEVKARKLIFRLASAMDPTVVGQLQKVEESYERCKKELDEAFKESRCELGENEQDLPFDEDILKEEMEIVDGLIDADIASRNQITVQKRADCMNTE